MSKYGSLGLVRLMTLTDTEDTLPGSFGIERKWPFPSVKVGPPHEVSGRRLVEIESVLFTPVDSFPLAWRLPGGTEYNSLTEKLPESGEVDLVFFVPSYQRLVRRWTLLSLLLHFRLLVPRNPLLVIGGFNVEDLETA